jgi:lipopolysaccharide/colanic/teichoic acid biosynthesis glycosyltransferase
MSRTKNESTLFILSLLLLLIAIIGGYFTLGQTAFFYFSLIALAGSSIQIWVFAKEKQRKEKQKRLQLVS